MDHSTIPAEIKASVKAAFDAIEDKKGENITVLDISKVSVIADYFIIAHGNNTNHVQAIADNVSEALEKSGAHLRQTEGYTSGGWILLDYESIIVHIFSQEERMFYNLERIWRDGKAVDIGEL